MQTDFNVRSGKRRTREERRGKVQVQKTIHPEAQFTDDLIADYSGQRATWIQEASEDEEMYLGVQWTPEEEATLKLRNQFPVVVNMVMKIIDQLTAFLTSNLPRFSATAKEDSDGSFARVIADLASHIWYVSRGSKELKTVIHQYCTRGMGAMQVYFDPFLDGGKGEVCIKAVDSFDVIVPPHIQDDNGSDAEHIIILKPITSEQFQSAYPQYVGKLEEAQEETVTNYPGLINKATHNQTMGPQFSSGSRVYKLTDRYSKVRVRMFNAIDNSNHTETRLWSEEELVSFLMRPAILLSTREQSQPIVITDEEKVTEGMKLFQETGGTYHFQQDTTQPEPIRVPGPEEGDPYAIPNSTTEMQIVVMQDLRKLGIIEILDTLDEQIKRVLCVGGVLLFEGVLPIKRHPIVLLMNRRVGNPYPQSDVRAVRQIQKEINKVRSMAMAHMANSTNVKVFVPEGSVDKTEMNREFAKVGTGIITFNAEVGTPVIAAPVPLPAEAYNMEQKMRADMEEILGIYALMQGDSSQAPGTYKGTVAMEEYGQRRVRSKQQDMEEFLNQVCKSAVEFMRIYYTEHKTVRLVQPNNITRQTEINMPIFDPVSNELIKKVNDITASEYDVIVVSGSMLPSNRWARFEYYMELFKTGIIDDIEVLKQTEVADVEGVINRSSMMKKMQSQMQAMGQEIKKLRGDLQTAERESVHAQKKVEVTKFAADLDKQKGRAELATSLFQARLQDELSMKKKEMGEDTDTSFLQEEA